jgi:hypothetical protein
MKKNRLITIAALTVLCATGAQAQSRTSADIGSYVEIGYSPVDISGSGGNAKPEAMRFLIGNELNKNLGLEAMYTTTVSKENRTGYEASFRSLGIFLKPKMALNESTEVFARLGLLRADITASSSGSHMGNDLAYGMGIQTNFTKTVYGQFDFLHSYDRDGITAKGYTLSLGTRF